MIEVIRDLLCFILFINARVRERSTHSHYCSLSLEFLSQDSQCKYLYKLMSLSFGEDEIHVLPHLLICCLTCLKICLYETKRRKTERCVSHLRSHLRKGVATTLLELMKEWNVIMRYVLIG